MTTANPNFTEAEHDLIILHAVIPIDTAVSEVINLKGTSLIGVVVPSTWTTATTTIQVSYDGTNFFNMYNSEGAYTLNTIANTFLAIPASDFPSTRYLKFTSSVNQAAEATLTILAREV